MYFIRQATTDDVGAIIQIADTTFWHTYSDIIENEQIDYMLRKIYSYETVSTQIATQSQTYIILIEEDKTIAFAAFSPRIENPEIYKLHKLYCLPQTQGKGYGRALLDEVIKQTTNAGKHILDLNVNRYNRTKAFYEKMGFVVTYEEDIPIGKFWMNDYVMRKKVS